MKNNHLCLFKEDIESLRDFNINNIITDKKLAEYYQTWLDQIDNKKIIDTKLWKYIENQINYWCEKDRSYANFLNEFLNECLENATKS